MFKSSFNNKFLRNNYRLFILLLSFGSVTVTFSVNALSIEETSDDKEFINYRPSKVLFVGNSFSYFNNGIHHMTQNLLKGAGKWRKKDNFKLMTISAGKLAHHAKTLPVFLTENKRQWDTIILQENSLGALLPEKKSKFLTSLAKLKLTISKHGAQPYLFMTWAYKNKPEMTSLLKEAFRKAGKTYDIPVVPVGLAFDYVRQHYPEINLYSYDVSSVKKRQVYYSKKVFHPNIAGSYLAACVFYSVLYQDSPRGNPFIANLPKKLASQLQTAAWQTVRNYQSY